MLQPQGCNTEIAFLKPLTLHTIPMQAVSSFTLQQVTSHKSQGEILNCKSRYDSNNRSQCIRVQGNVFSFITPRRARSGKL